MNSRTLGTHRVFLRHGSCGDIYAPLITAFILKVIFFLECHVTCSTKEAVSIELIMHVILSKTNYFLV
jgi:hypothetical protein